MPYNVSFISLGCAKNQVNCEQMMATVQHAGHNIVLSPEGADVAVVNTCGFLASACEEAIDNILEMAEFKKEGKLKKIIVTGCMAQRYKDDVLHELPEVDAVLGTGSYGEIARAVDEVMAPGGLRPCYMGDIQNCVQGGARILSTPSWYAYLRIAEGCDNCCAYCVIPRLRGRYRSRPMNELLDEASELASAGVKELIVIAQDITRYGTDLNGEHQLAALLRELCKLDFHWIRLHYLYPDDITDELIDTIAQEEKIVPYLDIPIQHCNDDILKAMNRRDTKESIRKVFHDLRAHIPGLVLRTSIIAGLPGEGEQEFEELCDFLREEKIERAGVFPFSPEEGTKAATMEHVPMEEAQRRTELLVDVQSDIIDEYNESVLGDVREVLCEGWSEEAQSFVGRSYAESVDIDGIRLHYLYPDDITDELIDTIAQEKKIVPYLDIPIQHCNDGILKAMNRRDTKESIRKVFHDLRAHIPGLVLRTSIIAGLPGEGEQEFEELCDFLREEKIERAGVFPFSPEEGTKAATMEHVPMEEAQRRTELLVDVQSDIIDEYNESVLGDVREVLCEGWSEEAQSFVGRSYAESVDIDGKIYFSAERDIMAGEFVNVRLTGTMDGELTGEAVE